MKQVSFITLLLLTIGTCYLLNNSFKIGDSQLPAIGSFINPFTGFWANAEKIGNYEDETFQFDALKHPVKVVYDQRKVPHIFAASLKDALFVQGFITAQNRLWQMDISSRSVGGRLAEILGPGKNNRILNKDKIQRRKGITLAAEKTVNAWQSIPENYQMAVSYTEGINAYIASLTPENYPLEFKLLGYQPEKWSPYKSALFVKAMAETLCARNFDIEASNALGTFGKDSFDIIYPEHNPKQSPIIPKNTPWNFEVVPMEAPPSASPSMIGAFPHMPFNHSAENIGSNNWAVDGSKTASGKPILCNDPHLKLTLPSIWFETQIHTPTSNTYGVSLPGLPGIIIGFNEHIAWGQTNVAHDVLDWYQIKWTDVDKSSYWLDGRKIPTQKLVEVIKVKGAATILDTVLYTKWGPVVYEDANHPYKDLAMKWLANDPNPNELDVFSSLSTATNFNSFQKALANYSSPAQNFVFASKDGDIGMIVSGKFPLKEQKEAQGRFVLDGQHSSNDWKGYIPSAHNPQIKNPARGFVSSANQRSTDKNYPYYYNGFFANYRGRIINEKLATMDQIKAEDMMRLQNNNYSLKAAEVLPLLLATIDESTLKNETAKNCYQVLKNWNYQFDQNMEAPIYFEEWFNNFHLETWDEVYQNISEPMLKPRHWRTIQLFLEMPQHTYFDQTKSTAIETAKDIALLTFEKMVDYVDHLKEEGIALEWKNYNQTNINHLALIDAFSEMNLPVSGHLNSINANQNGAGPSWRMIVELGEKVKAFGVYPGGQSGNPGSPYYTDMLNYWVSGKYYELDFLQAPEALNDRTLFTQDFQNN